jgi:hypothetical protein
MATEGEPPRPDRALDAALDSADPDRLLPSEDPRSMEPEDVRHWVLVYRQLVAFKERMLEETSQATTNIQPDARTEVNRTDAIVLKAESERLRRRLDFWQQRLRKLQAASARR